MMAMKWKQIFINMKEINDEMLQSTQQASKRMKQPLYFYKLFIYLFERSPGKDEMKIYNSKKIHAPLCSLQHYSQQARHGNNLNVHPQMNGLEDVAPTYNGILFSHKKNKIMGFAATWMKIEILILSEMSQKEKDTYHIISLVCGI